MNYKKYYFNREISWLDFNRRVLQEAIDPRTPLLEALRFCDIFKSNNDEFFMKRVGILRNRIETLDGRMSIDGMNAWDQLELIKKKVISQMNELTLNFEKHLVKRLEQKKIKLLLWSELKNIDRRILKTYFKENIFPILTPLAVDAGHPFPHVSNLSKSLGICLRSPKGKKKYFARLKIPVGIEQWISLPPHLDYTNRFINIEEVIKNNLDELFPGMKIESSYLFKITRNVTIADDYDDENESKMISVEEEIRERKFAPVVRIEFEKGVDPWTINILLNELNINEEDVYYMSSRVCYCSMGVLTALKFPEERYPDFIPKHSLPLGKIDDEEETFFDLIRKKDYLVHFPYESYKTSFELFVKSASTDPQVKAIKICLYRTDPSGTLIDSLLRAVENGIQVVCVIELKARFDEERNILWAQTLEEAGIHVSYGFYKYKTHAKMCLVVRQEGKALRTYANIGSGNYNSVTSHVYTDFSLFTCQKSIAEDTMQLFNFLTGRSLKINLKKILVAPFNMAAEFHLLIKREIARAKKGLPARIIAKMNSLEDRNIIFLLYQASQAGVKIELFVRGVCCLVPGINGLSHNIRVYSIVGRFLEHSRIFYFQNGEKNMFLGKVFIGSADWMTRNIYRRIEVVVPIEQEQLKKRIIDYLLLLVKDNRHLWELSSSGKYIQRTSNKSHEVNSQAILLQGSKDSI
jgi:polyphosphate kinase